MPLLEIKDLHLAFGDGADPVRVLDGVSLSVQPGETVCLVGESGSGKTVTALSLARLLPVPPARYLGGEILLDGRDVLKMSSGELRAIRGAIVSYVFQEPAAALNPVMRVATQIMEALKQHRPTEATEAEVVRLLRLVAMPAPETSLRAYPHELSGGMQQRVMLAMALAPRPKILVADEPTTALDVTVQAQILERLRDLKQQLGMALLLITHNLAIASDLADRIAVMYAGQIVETGPAADVLATPQHPYTRALLESVPRLGSATERLRGIPGTPPTPGSFPPGCRFHPRCTQAKPDCSLNIPALLQTQTNRWVRCPYSAEPLG